MSGGGSNPGERRGGRPRGSRNKATIKRELIEKAALERQITLRAEAPIQGKRALERLLGFAMEQFEDAVKAGDKVEIVACFDRALVAAREATKYQSPTYRAIALATTDLRPPVLDLTRLSAKQIEAFRQFVLLAGPSNVAQPNGDGAKEL